MERDRWLLEALAKMRFLTTGQIARLFFGSQSAANKRLRRLFDAGLVRVWVRSLAEENVYSATTRGLTLLCHGEASPIGGLTPTAPRRLDGNLDHLLAINQVRVGLATGLMASGGKLVSWRSDWELREHRRQLVIPDAIFTVHWPNLGQQLFALELEHATRAPQSFQRKLLRYAAAYYRPDGGVREHDPIVLVVGADAKWLARYRVRCAPMSLGIRVAFATLAEVERNATGAIWHCQSEETRHSLRALCTLPYRREESDRGSADISNTCAPPAAHIPCSFGVR